MNLKKDIHQEFLRLVLMKINSGDTHILGSFAIEFYESRGYTKTTAKNYVGTILSMLGARLTKKPIVLYELTKSVLENIKLALTEDPAKSEMKIIYKDVSTNDEPHYIIKCRTDINEVETNMEKIDKEIAELQMQRSALLERKERLTDKLNILIYE